MFSDFHNLPQFLVKQANQGEKPGFSGVFDSNLRLGRISYLINQDEICIEGKFNNYDEKSKQAIFIPKLDSQRQNVLIGKSHAFLDEYWGERFLLILDRTIRWNKEKYVSQEAIEYKSGSMIIVGKVGQVPSFPIEDKGRIIKNGWDHDHCAICWQTISEHSLSFGYINQNKTWVCENCYSTHILPRRPGVLLDWAVSQVKHNESEQK